MKKNLLQYYVTYERDRSGGYIAAAPAIQGCAVHGKTLAIAHRNIQAAIQECLAVRRQFQRRLPEETVTPLAMKRFSFVRLPDYA